MTTSPRLHPRALARIALTTVLATASCGGIDSLGPPPGGSGGAATTSSMGPTSGSGAGSTGTAGAGSTGTAGAGGSGVPDCTGQSPGFTGTLGGQAVTGTPRNGIAGIGAAGSTLFIVIFLEEQGILVIPAFITDPKPHPLALLRMPNDGPFPGTWFGFGPGSQLPTSDMAPGDGFVLTNAVQLGTCPGMPVSGGLSYCYDPSGGNACGGQMAQTQSTVGGQAMTWSTSVAGGIQLVDMFSELYWQNNAFLVASQMDGPMVGLLSMPLETGTEYEGGYADDIFCVNGGDNGSPTATFTDLSFLTKFADAPAGSGSIQGCF